MENKNVILDLRSGICMFEGKKIGQLNLSERRVLLFLINSHAKTVPRDILMDAGWPNKVTVPNSLNMAIKNIRAVLQDANLAESLVTIPKVGFRLTEHDYFKIIDHEGNIPAHSHVITSEPDNSASSIDIKDRGESVKSKLKKDVEINYNKKKEINFYLTFTSYAILLILLLFRLYLNSNEPLIICSEKVNSTYCGSGKRDFHEEKKHQNGSFIYGRNYDDSEKTIYYRTD